MSKYITFQEFSKANKTRCLKWHPQGIESWSDSDWITAIVGELGELASLIKMRNRERDGLTGNKFSPTDAQIAKEAADVYTYLDLFCQRNNIDLGRAAVDKFNEVSERVGFPDRILLEEEPAEDPSAPFHPKLGELVRYGDGSTALALHGEPHAGGWHGVQCMGGYTFYTKVYRPTQEDRMTWARCAVKWRNLHPARAAEEAGLT